MSSERSADSIIDGLPDWQGAEHTELSGGLSNRVWLLEKDGRKAVLKIDLQPRSTPFASRAEEAVVQSAAASAGLASQVLFAGEQVYLTAWVPGSTWNPSSLEQQGKTEQLAASLRQLHSLPLTGRSFDALGAAKRYAENAENADNELISLCLRIVRGAQLPNHLCCCHNDLVAENIITTPGLRFIDWEYACDNDPLFDLATIIEHHELADRHARALLDAYFSGSGEQWQSRLAEQQRLYLALYYLWTASRPDSSGKALRRLGVRLTTSYS
ncbi:MAG: phosphotransferase [Woeseiaceae bacterium]